MMWNHVSPLYIILAIISVVGNIYFLTDKYDLSSIFKPSSIESLRRSLISFSSDINSFNGFPEDQTPIFRAVTAKKPVSMRVKGERTHTDPISIRKEAKNGLIEGTHTYPIAIRGVEAKKTASMRLKGERTRTDPSSIHGVEAKKPDSMRVIGERTHTDKIYHHRYDRYYPKFLRHLRNKPMKMFEVGFLFGESYQMWTSYFLKGSVYFMDKGFSRDFWEKEKKRPDIVAKSFVGDQSLVSDLEKALDQNKLKGELDFIIDDGSHYPDHQLLTFQYFFEHGLKPGGVYIIEDIEQNYWYRGNSYGYDHKFGKDHPKSVITVFKKMVDVVNREFSSSKDPFVSGLGQAVDKWVSSVTFGYNCIIITKMDEEEFGFAHRPYRYSENTTPVDK